MPKPNYDQGLKLAAEGRHVEAIACFEQGLAENPSDTKILFALGNTARALGQPALARDFFAKVLALEPERIEALVNLANLLRQEGQFAAARAVIAPALARNPQSAELHVTMGSAWREDGERDRATMHYRSALEANPNCTPALANLADLLGEEGEREAALKLYARALKSDPRNAQIKLNRAMLHLAEGNLKDGWRDYAARTEIRGKVPATQQKFSAWTGGSLHKIRLLVRCEQGVGDELMFASLFGELVERAGQEGGSIILECDQRLVTLFTRSIPGATVHAAQMKNQAGQVTADYGWLKTIGGASAAILAGSLPRYLRKSLEDFPADHAFFTPDLAEQVRWHGVFAGLGPSPAIGLCWRSGKVGGHRAVQYAPLARWGEFLKSLPGSLVSAQYDASAEEIAELEQISGRKIFVPPGLDQKNELDRTAAMLSALDVLITAPTAVAWLGAGLGVKTLKMQYYKGWTSFGRDHEPLAPACLCVAPEIAGDWPCVFRQATEIIAQL